MTDRTDLVLIALTFPGCSIYLCISGNRPVQSDVLYLGSPSPPQTRNNRRLKASPMPEDERAKSFPRQRTHQGFTWVRTNKRTSPQSVTIWLKRQWVSFVIFISKQQSGWENTLASASLKAGSDRIGIAEGITKFGFLCRKLPHVLQSEMGHILSSLSH